MEPEETVIAKQLLGEQVQAATNTHETIESCWRRCLLWGPCLIRYSVCSEGKYSIISSRECHNFSFPIILSFCLHSVKIAKGNKLYAITSRFSIVYEARLIDQISILLAWIDDNSEFWGQMVLSSLGVTIDGVQIGDLIYWPIIHTTRNYQQLTAPPLIFTIHKSPQHSLSAAVPWQRLLPVKILQLHALRFYLHSLLCRTLLTSDFSPCLSARTT
jgi:hypothetical protein